MDIIYRLMGVAARVNERLSRRRINFIPLNWVAMIALGALAAVGVSATSDAVVNRATPRPTTVGALLAHRDVTHNYVSVQGTLYPGEGFTYGKQNSTADHTWAPILDPQQHRALFVEIAGNDPLGDKAQAMTVTGMLRPLDGDLATKVKQLGGSVDGVPVDTDYMLVQGERPGSAAGWGLVTALSGLALLLLVVTFLLKYVVFQRDAPGYAREEAAPPGDAPIDVQQIGLRATGEMRLDARHGRRFLDVPVGLVTLDTGEPALVSNIDASSRFMGITTQKRAGVWSAVMRQGSLRPPEPGRLYVGLAVRPALRVSYVEAASGKAATSILSFADEVGRRRVLQALTRPGA